jgi:hypothetical protein
MPASILTEKVFCTMFQLIETGTLQGELHGTKAQKRELKLSQIAMFEAAGRLIHIWPDHDLLDYLAFYEDAMWTMMSLSFGHPSWKSMRQRNSVTGRTFIFNRLKEAMNEACLVTSETVLDKCTAKSISNHTTH